MSPHTSSVAVLTWMIPGNNFQSDTCRLHGDNIYTEDYTGVTETFATWCNNNHLEIKISKTKFIMRNELEYLCVILFLIDESNCGWSSLGNIHILNM